MSVSSRSSLLLAATLHFLGTAALAATLHVNSSLDQPDIDSIDGICRTIDDTCTLRAAVMEANATDSGGETTVIYLPAGLYQLTRPPVGNNGADSGDLNFAPPDGLVYVIGSGAESTIVDGGGLDGVFNVEAGRQANFYSLTVRNGASPSQGGGILVLGYAHLYRVTVRDNQAQWGGGVAARGPLFSMTESTIRDNAAEGVGGGRGGGLVGGGNVTVDRSTISGNLATYGGGIALVPTTTLSISESTISSNRARHVGGGIHVVHQDTVNVYSSTIAFNMADSDDDGSGDGGGLYNENGTVNIRNTLIAGNYIVNFFDWDDCVGTINSYGRNLFFDVAGCSIVTGSGTWGLLNDLGWIGPLEKNGGATQTHALYPGSNAIDGGDPVDGCAGPLGPISVDQRGVPRVSGPFCDVGAYEEGVLFTDGFEPGDLSTWPSAWSG
jgi:hypothetical protein